MAAFDGADEPGPKTSLREKIYEELGVILCAEFTKTMRN